LNSGAQKIELKIPPGKKFSDICPFISILFMSLKNNFFFIISPRFFIYFRVQMIMPSKIDEIN